MEVKNKEKIVKSANKRKFSFGNLKTRNKIIFGFFVIAFISGFLNYISGSLVVSKFADFSRTLQLSSSIVTEQEDLELIIEDYISTKDYDKLPENDFAKHENAILENIKIIGLESETSAQESAVLTMGNKNKELLNAGKEAMAIHKSLGENNMELIKAFAEEENLKTAIKNYVLGVRDKELQERFLFFENKSDEVTFEFKGRLHIHSDEWLSAFNDFKLYAKNNQLEIPNLEKYEILGLKVSGLLEEVEKGEIDEQNKLSEIRKIRDELHNVQGSIFEVLMNEKINSVNDLMHKIVIGFLVLTILLTVFFGYAVSYFIVSPLRKLVKFTLDVGKGDLKKRIEVDTDDEIGQTAEAFNSMLDRVEESTQVLEVKISARTKRLEELSQDLEAQINNRTKELTEKIKELEMFNDLAVGRELTMVELKKEIAELKKKISVKKESKKRPGSQKKTGQITGIL